MKIIVLAERKEKQPKKSFHFSTDKLFSLFSLFLLISFLFRWWQCTLIGNLSVGTNSQLRAILFHPPNSTLWPTPLSYREGMPAILEFNSKSFTFSDRTEQKKIVQFEMHQHQPWVSCLHQRNWNILFNDMFMFTILCCYHQRFITTVYKHSSSRELSLV